MSIPEAGPSRKQKFDAALKLSGMSVLEWRTKIYKVSAQHWGEIWRYDADPSTGRKPSAELLEAIDSFIADTFARFAPTGAST